MDWNKMDPDFMVRQTSYTKRYYRNVYGAIDPGSPALSQRGKVVVVTGASSGIGAQVIAPAFAKAGARAIVLVGRRRHLLQAVATEIRAKYPSTEVLGIPTNISDMIEVQNLFSTITSNFGAPDILVNNAGVFSQRASLLDSDPLKWWTDFEVNIHGTYLVTRAFLKCLDEKPGVIINMSAGASRIILAGRSSAYSISKGAVNRMTEYIAAECPKITVVSMDPGSVLTEAMDERFKRFSLDTPELVGAFSVWLTIKDASFLTGRFVCVNWDVEELMARKNEIVAGNDLKTIVQGQFGVAV